MSGFVSRRTATRATLHLAIAATAYVVAFALRFDLTIPWAYLEVIAFTLPLVLSCKLLAFWMVGLLDGWWRYVGVRDAVQIARGNVLASTLFLVVMVFTRGLHGFPRSVFLLDLNACVVLMGGIRLAMRVLHERREAPAVRRVDTLVLIAGAGDAGIRLLEEIEQRPRLKLAVAGLVDDEPAKIGLSISGVSVLGGIDDIPVLVRRHEVGEVLIAIPSATGAALRRIVGRCGEAGVRHRVLPSLGELASGRVMYTQMREVKVDDLLARAPVRLDVPAVRSLVHGRTVLITGAAGSIGSELCRQVALHKPARLVLLDRHENGVFVLEGELRTRFPDVVLAPILGDVLLRDQLRQVFARHRPDLVLHAAAYKHLPLAERNVIEAMRNNVLGTHNVAEAAMAHGAGEFVLVSTDKAVHPSSVMGATKRAAELVVQGLQNGCCRYMAVRFGNVLGSSGSVVPIFREQIARGGPVTVTHPDATRYFMTIPEAAQLILQAAALGQGAEIFILEMGEPVRIEDLARQMIRLSGFEPEADIAVTYTGLRPGEKLHEELFEEGEELITTYHDRIRIVRPRAPHRMPAEWLAAVRESVEEGEEERALALLQSLVQSYRAPLIGVAATGTDAVATATR